MCKKLKIDIIKEKSLNLGYECLSDEYINNTTKLEFKCNECNGVFYATWNRLSCEKTSFKCENCNKKIYWDINLVNEKCT